MPWIWYGIISVVSVSIANLFQKIAMKDEESDPVISSIQFQFLLTALSLAFALIKGFSLPDISLLPYFFASACLYAFGTISIFRAIKHIEASELSVLSGAGVFVTILVSVLFLGDRITGLQLVGAVLVLLAVLLVSLSKHVFTFTKNTWLAIIGTSSNSLAVVFDSFILRHYSAISFLPFACLGPGIILMICFIKRTPAIVKSFSHMNRNLLFFSFLYVIQAITFYNALEKGALVGQMSTIAKASIVLTVLLATVFLGEKKALLRKFFAAVLVTIGVIMVA